ncbi:MAG TPA: IS110 family transposase [Candidatus Dormibacteraeota bacterium]|nr:IS110 family transposase [Candidatus Dormibacteraeota bacterium]
MVIGIDSHKETLAACAVDDVGRQEAAAEFPNSRAGHASLMDWALQLPGDHVFAIEGSGGFGRSLATHLAHHRQTVVEVPSRLTARERRRLRTPGKSDPGDVLAISRVALREDHLPQPASTGWSRSLRELVDYREQLVGERTRCANRLHADLIELSPGYQVGVKNLVSKRYLARTELLLADNSLTRAGLARRRLQALRRLDLEIAELKREITQMVEASGTNLTAITGISTLGAARILAEVGDVRRFASENHFASATGTAPVRASSGSVRRHRLNRGGNRRLNRAIHTVALVQAQIDPRGRAYVERRRTEGKSWREALRCLKRHLSNVIYRQLVKDGDRPT